jgi:hypothetical protein
MATRSPLENTSAVQQDAGNFTSDIAEYRRMDDNGAVSLVELACDSSGEAALLPLL